MVVSAIKPMALALAQTALSIAIFEPAPQNRPEAVSHASGSSQTVWDDPGSSGFQSNSFDYILNDAAGFVLGHKPLPSARIVLTHQARTRSRPCGEKISQYFENKIKIAYFIQKQSRLAVFQAQPNAI